VKAAAGCLTVQIYTTMKYLTTLKKSAHDLKRSVAVTARVCLATLPMFWKLYIRASLGVYLMLTASGNPSHDTNSIHLIPMQC